MVVFVVAAALGLSGCGGSAPQVAVEETLGQSASAGDLRGSIFVSPTARRRTYQKVAVMPFRAPAELVGASVSDMFATELLRTYKYDLVERSQMEQVLGEQALGLKGVTLADAAAAQRVGKLLGVQGVIVGTVPEYGAKASAGSELAAIGVNVRMIDVSDGSIVWSVTDSGISDRPISLSAFAKRLLQLMVTRLTQEWVRAGDTQAVNLPIPQVVAAQGKIRGVTVEFLPDPTTLIAKYAILRSRTEQGPYQAVATLENDGAKSFRFEDRDLADAETYYYKIASVARSGLAGPPHGPVKIATVGPPPAVTGLTARSELIRKVSVAWQPSADSHVERYVILRKPPTGPWAKVETLSGRSQATYTDSSLEDAKTYSYRVVAVNVVGVESPPSVVVTATTKGPPSTVPEVSATGGQARKVPLVWKAVDEPEVKGYAVYRAKQAGGPFEQVALVDGKDQVRHVDTGKRVTFGGGPALEDGTRYFYRVRAVNVVDVQGGDSPVAEAVTKPVPVAVGEVQAAQLEVKQVTLSWQANPESDIAKYEVLRGTDAAAAARPIQELAPGTLRFVDRELKDGASYYYRVRAVDRDGLVGKPSEPVAARTKPVPTKPAGLEARIVDGHLSLSWRANPEPDIARYAIVQRGFLTWTPVGESTDPSFAFQGELKKGKTLTFRVVAVDRTRLESEPSDEVTVTVP